MLWDTRDLGYLTVHAAYRLAKGELAPDATAIVAGRLGARRIEDRNVLLDRLLVFGRDNIDQFDV